MASTSISRQLILLAVFVTTAFRQDGRGTAEAQQNEYPTTASGKFQTPGYPGLYLGSQDITWHLSLAKNERLSLISGDEEPEFEEKYDFFKVFVDRIPVLDLGKMRTPVGQTWWEYEAQAVQTMITLVFHSDRSENKKGLKGEYRITCSNTSEDGNPPCLNKGVCTVKQRDREPFLFPPTPVRCECHPGFYGDRCAERQPEPTILNAGEGRFQTPYDPNANFTGLQFIWRLELQQFEVVTFRLENEGASQVKKCCNFFRLFVNGTHEKDLTDFAKVIARDYPTTVELKFQIDDAPDSRRGVRGQAGTYKVACMSQSEAEENNAQFFACPHERVCTVNRTADEVGPVYCDCPKHYSGSQCEQFIHTCNLDCGRGGQCVWESTKFICKCALGFVHTGSGCEDIDECQSSPCQNPFICINQPGSYLCKCPTDAGYQEIEWKERTDCIHSGCSKPWIYNGANNSCFLLSESRMEEDSAGDFCKTQESVLAQIHEKKDNELIGLASKAPLVWFGLSSQGGIGKWKWTGGSANKPSFTNWGPGFPSGNGPLALLYPNKWSLGSCHAKKLFLCQASEPYCPSEWVRLRKRPQTCFYQSDYQMDFKAAQARCASLALGGRLASWDMQTALAFGPEHWDTSADAQGLAHFWVAVGECHCRNDGPNGCRGKNKGCSDAAEPGVQLCSFTQGSSDEEGLLDQDPVLTANERAVDLAKGLCGPGYELDKCGFVYPNTWADFSAFGKSSEHHPTVACQRPTTARLIEMATSEDHLEVGLSTEVAPTQVATIPPSPTS